MKVQINNFRFYSRAWLDATFGVTAFGILCDQGYKERRRMTLPNAFIGGAVATVIWPQALLIYGALNAVGAVELPSTLKL